MKPAKPKRTDKSHPKKREKPLKLDMSFDEAMKRLAKTPPPKKGKSG